MPAARFMTFEYNEFLRMDSSFFVYQLTREVPAASVS